MNKKRTAQAAGRGETGVLVAPSILSADFADLKSDILSVERGGAEIRAGELVEHPVEDEGIGVPARRHVGRAVPAAP